MPKLAEGPIPLRLVIQQVGLHPVPHYRVIVYGDEVKPRHSDFGSAAALLDALRAAVPALDVSQFLLSPLRDGQGSIAFDGEMLLSGEQLVADCRQNWLEETFKRYTGNGGTHRAGQSDCDCQLLELFAMAAVFVGEP